jgi:hypothetical protein
MGQVENSYFFAKYFHEIYSKYIPPCMIMIYAMSDALQVMPQCLHTLCSGATVRSKRVGNTMNGSQEEIG